MATSLNNEKVINALKGRSLLTLADFTKDEIIYLIDLADDLKAKKKAGVYEKNLANKNIALLFEKPSTRTRCAFVTACNDEGAHPEYLGHNDIQLGFKESVEDTARVLGRMFDGIEFRGFYQTNVEKLSKYSGVPVWNGLTDEDHPTQALADLMTIREKLGKVEGVNITYIGDGRNNVANAIMIFGTKVGMNVTICTCAELLPADAIYNKCLGFAKESGGSLKTVIDPIASMKDTEVVYTDVWVSMGEEAKGTERIQLLKPYQVNQSLLSHAKPDVAFLHCLPAVKGYEVTEDVFERHADVIFDQAENRAHTIKAVMVATLRK